MIYFELVVTSTLAPQLAQKRYIQNGVNIQDGDFTFSISPPVPCVFAIFKVNSDRKLYNNK
jgi:hypothetical protein